jgi:hypothetical protein
MAAKALSMLPRSVPVRVTSLRIDEMLDAFCSAFPDAWFKL